MDSPPRKQAPLGFWVIALLLTLWGAAGVYACYLQFVHGAEALGPATPYDRALYARMPVWYNYCYAVAVGTMLGGGVAMIFRSGLAGMIFFVSLIAALVQFGYLFATTNIIIAKGPAQVLPFPIVIIAVAAFATWFAVDSYRRRWVN